MKRLIMWAFVYYFAAVSSIHFSLQANEGLLQLALVVLSAWFLVRGTISITDSQMFRIRK